jgi:hypothetical protein
MSISTNNITGQESHSQSISDSISILIEEEISTPRPNLLFADDYDYVVQLNIVPVKKRKSVSFAENLCEIRYFTTAISPLIS